MLIGDLTQSGERQHYLEGFGLKKTYGPNGEKMIADELNPKEFLIMSTDFNRTIMSAYSQNLGYFPLGTMKDLQDAENEHALPPFTFDGESYPFL